MATIKPFQDDIEDKSLHSVWTKELYKFFRDFFSTVEVGPAEDFDDEGNPIIHREPGTGKGWTIPTGEGGEAVNYGFKVWVEEDEHGNYHVMVNDGTAQFWGGDVKTYPAADLGEAEDGKYVYAVLNLYGGWNATLSYDNMTGQDADEEVWVPIARISGSADVGFSVTQHHGGNIVVPAVTNAVDVQVQGQQQSSPS